jgi:hypothetical protein
VDKAGTKIAINTQKIFIATGIDTPYFIKETLNPDDQLYQDASI